MRINHPVFDPFQTAPFYPRFTVQQRTLSAPVTLPTPLSSRTRPQTAPSVPTMPSPAPDHTTRPAPLCASTRAPDAAPTLSRCPASHTPRPTHKPLQAPVSAFTPSPRVLYHPAPKRAQSAPESPL